MLSKFSHITLLLIFVTLNLAQAQNASWNYGVRSGQLGDTYDWVDCSDGTELSADEIIEWSYAPEDDGRWGINWPFNFSFYDDNYNTSDRISICTNGFIRLDGIASISYTAARSYILNSSGINFGQIIALGISDDDFSDDNSHCFYKVIGTAPNRKLIIEFQDMSIYRVNDIYADAQVEFHEGTNKVVLKTGDNNVNYDNADHGIHSGKNGYYFYWQETEYATQNSWIEFTPPASIPSPQNTDSYADNIGVTQPSTADIPSSAYTSATAQEVFRFAVFDKGSSDGTSTKIQKIRINKHNSSTADWNNTVAGVVLNDGTKDLSIGVVTVYPTYIDILLEPDELVVADGGRTDISMSLYLKNAGRDAAGKTFRFYIDVNNHGWHADYSGSLLASNFGGSDIISNTFTITYTPTHLKFITQPLSLVHVNNKLAPPIQAAVTDIAGNIDTWDISTNITLTNIEGVGMSNATATVSNGIATFTNLTFTETGGPFELYANSAPNFNQAISTNITVAIKAILFTDNFDEEDKGWSVSGGQWQKGNQNEEDRGPGSPYSGNNCYGTVLNGRYRNNASAFLTSPIFDLSDTNEPQITFYMDMESQNGLDGGTVQLRVKNGASWGDWTTINQNDPAYYGTTPNHSDIDGMANDVDGWTGNQPAGDWAIVGIDIFNITTSGLGSITANSQIQLRFWFGSNGNNKNNGWYIDDFEISYSVFHGLWKKTAINTDWNDTKNWDDGVIPLSTTSVQIPEGAAFYPNIDEIATCRKIVTYDGGELSISSGGSLSVGRYISIGEGTSGSFTMNGGTCNITEDFFSQAGSLIDINGGIISFRNWALDLNNTEAKGNIELSGGTITAAGNVLYSGSQVTGKMEGDFTFKIKGDYLSHHNTTDNQWSVVTGGTINLTGLGGKSYIRSSSGNSAVAYNLLVSNGDIIETQGNVTVFNNCTIISTAFLTVSSGNTMHVAGQLLLQSEDKSTASLLDYGNVTYGSATMQRYLSKGRWHAIASPTSSPAIDLFNEDNFYYYNESIADKWSDNLFVDGSGTQSEVTGWKQPNQTIVDETMRGFFTYYNHYTPTVQFTGTLNTGSLNFSLSKNTSGFGSQFDGWNLVGNPYPSAIDLDLVNATGLANAAFYFFEDDGSSSYNNYCYYIPSLPGSPYPGIAVNSRSKEIPANMAFFVKAENDGTIFQLDNSVRVHSRENINKKNETYHSNLLRLSLNSSNQRDETVVRLIPEATAAFDGLLDAIKLPNPQVEIAQLYSLSETAEVFAINSLPSIEEDLVVPLGVTITEQGTHSISFDEINFENTNVFLRDRQLGNVVNLKDLNAYEFFSLSGDFKQRFEIVFSKKNQIQEIAAAEIQVIGGKQKVQIDFRNGVYNNSIVHVFDASGKLISTKYINDEPWVEMQVNGSGGIYLITVKNETTEHSQQVLVY